MWASHIKLLDIDACMDATVLLTGHPRSPILNPWFHNLGAPPVKFGLGGVPLGNEFEVVSDEDAYQSTNHINGGPKNGGSLSKKSNSNHPSALNLTSQTGDPREQDIQAPGK